MKHWRRPGKGYSNSLIWSIDYTKWKPLSVDQISDLLIGIDADWLLAGGYALEPFEGKSYRKHGDIEIIVSRDSYQISQTRNTISLYIEVRTTTERPIRLWYYITFIRYDIVKLA